MNVYKVLTFDGFMSKEIIIDGFNVVSAIQTHNTIPLNQIIKVELVGSQVQENHTSYSPWPAL